jgi:hypothetical protein
MEDWKNGRMKHWKNGMMEYWNNGFITIGDFPVFAPSLS